jgi:hypothetical protein
MAASTASEPEARRVTRFKPRCEAFAASFEASSSMASEVNCMPFT